MKSPQLGVMQEMQQPSRERLKSGRDAFSWLPDNRVKRCTRGNKCAVSTSFIKFVLLAPNLS